MAALTREERDAIVRDGLHQLGDIVKTARKNHKFTVAKAAAACGLSPKHLTDVEAGKNLSVAKLLLIAAGLDLHHITLVNGLLDFESTAPATDVEVALRHMVAAVTALSSGGNRESNDDGASLSNDGMTDNAARRTAVTSDHPKDELPAAFGSTIQLVSGVPARFRSVKVSGELLHGQRIEPLAKDEYVRLPDIAPGELVLRIGDESLRAWGVRYGELLIVDQHATPTSGDLVLALINDKVIVGRYAEDDGRKRIASIDDPATYVDVAREDRLEVFGTISMIARTAK